jgi:preprotein translocase subunit SecE
VQKLQEMNQILGYAKESYTELAHKVTWPTWAKLQSSTVLVIVASLMIAAVVFVMDAISKGALEFLIYGKP